MTRPLLLAALGLLGLLLLLEWRFGRPRPAKERLARWLHRPGMPRLVANLPVGGFGACAMALAVAAFAWWPSDVTIALATVSAFVTALLLAFGLAVLKPPWLRDRLAGWGWPPDPYRPEGADPLPAWLRRSSDLRLAFGMALAVAALLLVAMIEFVR